MKRILLIIFSVIFLLTGLLFSSSVIGSANWWEEKFGKPQSGGKIAIVTNRICETFDPFVLGSNLHPYEQLFMGDMTIHPDEWSFKTQGVCPKTVGLLAKSWEWSDPQTLIVNLRQDVYWQDKQPVNGRKFNANDVVYHYDRILGTGSGFTKPNPTTRGYIAPVNSVSSKDEYSIIIKFKGPETMFNWWAITDPSCANMIEPREFVESNTKDWHNATGTGALMITDFVSGSALTMSKNPNYYRNDQRYPVNRLPYIDTLKILFIMDKSTQLAAIRTGQAELVLNLDWQAAKTLEKANPDLVITSRPSNGYAIDMKCDRKPFNDIRVRKALQMAIDTQTIAESYYGGTVSGNPSGLLSREYKGWSIPYENWPQDLKDEYRYNPDKARNLLSEAGYPNGFKTNVYTPVGEDVQLIEIIKSYFADIGVDMTINQVDRPTLAASQDAGIIDQMYYTQYSDLIFPIHINYLSRTTMYRANAVNADKKETSAYDDLYIQFSKATDETTAKKLGLQMEEYFLRQHWAIHTTERRRFDISQSYLKGFNGEDLMTSYFMAWFMEGLWIDQKQKETM